MLSARGYRLALITDARGTGYRGALSQIENTLALVQLLRRFTPEYAGPVPAKIHATAY